MPHNLIWTDNVSNSNDDARTLQCVADFYLAPDHDAALIRSALRDVALTSASLNYNHNVVVVLKNVPWGTHYKVRAYPSTRRTSSSSSAI